MPTPLSRLSPVTCVAPALAPTAAAPAAWDTAVGNVHARGTASTTAFGDTIGLADIQGPRDGDHTAHYMNVWGARNAQGEFFTNQVTLVSESWQHQPDGNIRIDQWIHQMSPDGTERRSMHNFVSETTGGRILQTGSIPFTQEEAAAHAADRIQHFSTFQPAPSQGLTDQRGDDRALQALRSIDGCATLRPAPREPAASGFSLRR